MADAVGAGAGAGADADAREMTAVTAEELRLPLDGAVLEVRRMSQQQRSPRHDDEAAAGGPTVVLLHEGLGCVAMWKELPRQLAEELGLPVVAYSRAGYGGSSAVAAVARPLDYLRDEGVRVLPRLLAALGVRDVVLVGHSDGASIALAYAARVGAGAASAGAVRLRGVVAMAPHTFVEALALESIARAREAYEHGELRERLARHHGDDRGANVDGAFWGWNAMWLDPAFTVAGLDAELPAIEVPVLAIQGRQDEYGTLRQLEVIARRSGGPVEQLVLEGCGHSPHRDQPEATRAAIVRFVQQVNDAGTKRGTKP